MTDPLSTPERIRTLHRAVELANGLHVELRACWCPKHTVENIVIQDCRQKIIELEHDLHILVQAMENDSSTITNPPTNPTDT